MKKSERLNGIIFTLKEKGKMTAHELADHFEVSVRTIYRDIDALSQLKVPIITHDGVYGGYTIDFDYFMPSISLSEQEVIMLMLVLNYGDTIKLPNLTADYKLLKGKVINTLTDLDRAKVNKLMKHIYFGHHRVEPSSYSQDVLKPILDSFIQALNLDIKYYNPRRDTYDQRLISPSQLFFEEGGWYLTAFCHLRQEKRSFRLDRIKSIHLSQTKNTYIDKDIHSSTDKFKPETYHMTIDRELYRVLKDNDYFNNVTILNGEDEKCLDISFKTAYQEDILNITLANPTAIRVTQPEGFVKKVTQISEALKNKYL